MTEAKDTWSRTSVQTGSGAHPSSCPMGAGGIPSAGVKRPQRETNNYPLPTTEVKDA